MEANGFGDHLMLDLEFKGGKLERSFEVRVWMNPF